HRPVEFGRVSVLVGVVTPEAVFQIGEEGLLGSGVERFAADDQAGAVGPVRQVDQVGDFTHLRYPMPIVGVLSTAVLVQRWFPPFGLGVGGRNRSRYRLFGGSDSGESDVAGPAPMRERHIRRRVGPHQNLTGHLSSVVSFQVTRPDRKSTRLNSSHVKTSYAVF